MITEMNILLRGIIMCVAALRVVVSLEHSGFYPYEEEAHYDDDSNYSAGYDTDPVYETYSESTRCDCKIGYNSDEVNCTSDVRFQHVMECGKHSVFIGGKCWDNETSLRDYSDFCDGSPLCDNDEDEPRGQIGFKCPIRNYKHIIRIKQERCTLSADLIERWKNAELSPNLTVYSICPDQDDICYKNHTSILDITKCFQCLDGMVIATKQVCDGVVDCLDLSDECLCLNKTKEITDFCESQNNCDEHEISWGNSVVNYTCISKSDFHNSENLMWKDCPSCRAEEINFTCERSGHARISVGKCDKRPECGEELVDECEDCPNIPAYCNHIKFGMHNCEPINNESKAKVENDEQNLLYLCDGVIDCQNSTDEDGCDRISCNDRLNRTYDSRQRCDFRMDCENGADETGCEDGRIYCIDNKPPGVPVEKIDDGRFDCVSGKDECNYKETSFSSGEDMMKSPFIFVSTWIFALMALLGNSMVIYACSKDLRVTYQRGTIAANRARVGVCNKILVLNLAIADFLMGIYLLTLGIKAWQYKGTYCSKWQEWRSSTLCSGIGALAMLSSQTSVLIMVMMTSYRFYSVRSPFRAERLKARYLVAGVLCFCWLPPLFVAFFPLHENAMAFAFQPIARLRHFPTFMIEKVDFEHFVYNAWTAVNGTEENFRGYDWTNLLETFFELFPNVSGGQGEQYLVQKWYGYYSADSVCLPRLFPNVGDSGWEYTAGVIIFDFIAFVYILFAYTVMYVCTVKRFSARKSNTMFGRGSSFDSDEVRSRENRVIWHRISRLIITDFVCWVPICITCVVSLAGYKIEPLMYQISAIIFLPINSAVNPLLYSNIVCRPIQHFVNVLKEKIKVSSGHRGQTVGIIDPSSKARSAVASAMDETRESRDGLVSDNRSLVSAEVNRHAAINLEAKPLMSSNTEGKQSEQSQYATTSTSISPSGDSKTTLSECIARLGLRRFFSERKVNDLNLEERSTLPRRQRPKSQSTTSTGTTFTSCGEV